MLSTLYLGIILTLTFTFTFTFTPTSHPHRLHPFRLQHHCMMLVTWPVWATWAT